MLFLRLYRFFSGKVKLSVKGDFAERFLNLCAHNGITVWGIRKKNEAITCFMLAGEYKRLHVLLRDSRLRVHIIGKFGFPFIVRRYRRRWGIPVGAVMFFSVLYALSGFVWNITVSGNDKISDEEIIKVCESIGIYEGAVISEIDPLQKRVELIRQTDGLAWAAINIEGSVLTVDVTEADDKKGDSEEPCNLLAEESGKIVKTEVLSGISAVKTGDFVAEGEVLVSGIYELSDGRVRLVRSEGTVIAEIEKTLSATVPLAQQIREIKEEKTRCALSLFGLKIPLFLGEIGGEYVRENSRLVISNGEYYLPVYVHVGKFRKVEDREVKLTPEKAEKLARESLADRLKDSKIMRCTESVACDGESVTVKYDAVLRKNIAKEKNLLFGTVK